MPASIERSIREENLRFMQNRDVFSEDYYSFLYEVTIGMDLLQKLYILILVLTGSEFKLKGFWIS